MTTQTVQLQTFDYGASLTSATLRNVADDTLVATADSVNEVTADSGLYAAVFGEASVIAAGTYRFRAVVGGQPINRYVTLAGVDAEVVQARSERAVELDSDTLNKLDAILEDTSTTLPAQIAGISSVGGGGGSTTISDEDIQEIVAGVTAVAPRICDSSAGTFRMTAGDTWIQDFTVTTTGADKFIVAVKNDAADADTAAVLLIDSADGLERINGAVPSNAGDASIATGAATITATVQSNITLMIVPGKYVVTVKKLDVGSDVTAISTASLTVFAPGVSEIST
jgi:hypothetical protein